MCKNDGEYLADKYLKRCMRYSQEVDHLKALIDHQLKGHDEMRKELSEAQEENIILRIKLAHNMQSDAYFRDKMFDLDKEYYRKCLNKYEEAIKKEFKNNDE